MVGTLNNLAPSKRGGPTPKLREVTRTYHNLKPSDVCEFRHQLVNEVSLILTEASFPTPFTENLEMVIGEILTNFCRHGGDKVCELRINVKWPMLRARIVATNPTTNQSDKVIRPSLPPKDLLEDHGRGIKMIAAYSSYCRVSIKRGIATTSATVSLDTG